MSSSTTPQFYSFEGSVWCSAPRLAIVELGYPKSAVEVKTTNLLEGENFNPDFLKLAPNGTLPTLVVEGGKVLDDTDKVVKYLIKNSPTPVASTSNAAEIIAAVHEEGIDPNSSLLFFSRNDEERKAKAGDVPGQFWSGRQKTLEKYVASPPADLKKFYDEKLELNTKFYNIYKGSPDDATLKAHYSEAAALWKTIGTFLHGKLPEYLSQRKGAYFGGDKPGEVDFHVIAWLARTVTAGGGLDKLEESIGGNLDDQVKAYYKQWAARDSFKDLGIM